MHVHSLTILLGSGLTHFRTLDNVHQMASFGSSKMNKSSFRLILDSKTTDDKLTTENPLLPAGLSEKKDHPPKILDKILNIATIQGKFFADENGYNSENTHF